MRAFYYFIAFIILSIILLSLKVYLDYKDILIFAPHIFFTELIKFVSLSIIWTVIIKYYDKSKSINRKKNHINILLISNLINLQNSLSNGLKSNELSIGISLILNNINSLKLLHSFSGPELSSLTLFETNFRSPEFQESIRDIEFHVEKNLNYSAIDSCHKISNELKNLNHVFGN
jgi:hypothetical protein